MSVNSGTVALNIRKTEGWERSDFPIVCETCLGENPYVRMMRAEFDKECKVCARPFTVFRWRPGTTARFKKTEICQTCAKLKNVCQTCLLDLEFGLPVQVRDTAFAQGSTTATTVPLSDINREWAADQAERQLASGQIQFSRVEQRAALSKLARNAPYYKRNEAHVCSFFLKGTCTRGTECPYRHETPNPDEHDPELASQNIKDRYQGTNDPVAKKMMNRLNTSGLAPPSDPNIKTLYVGNLSPEINEEDIKGALYAYGEITEVKLAGKGTFAFVTFSTREGAENAIQKVGGTINVKGAFIRLAWKKPTPLDGNITQGNLNFNIPNPTSANSNFTVPPPPNPSAKPVYASMNPQQFGSKTDR